MSEGNSHLHFGEPCECEMTEEQAHAALAYIADLEAVIKEHGGDVPARPDELKPRLVKSVVSTPDEKDSKK
jgi:hypothetical protein